MGPQEKARAWQGERAKGVNAMIITFVKYKGKFIDEIPPDILVGVLDARDQEVEMLGGAR